MGEVLTHNGMFIPVQCLLILVLKQAFVCFFFYMPRSELDHFSSGCICVSTLKKKGHGKQV